MERIGRVIMSPFFAVTVGILISPGWLGCARWSGEHPPGDGAVIRDTGPRPDGGDLSDGGTGWDGGGDCDPDPLPVTAGASCAEAIDLGDISDVQSDVIIVTGPSVPAGRQVWWKFRATDDLDTDGDEFHVDVRFLVNSEDAYEMDVYRNSCSSSDQVCTSVTGPFDWFTDFLATSTGCVGPTPCGEGDCLDPSGDQVEGLVACADSTAVFFLVVRRIDGLASCEGFTLQISNGLYSAL